MNASELMSRIIAHGADADGILDRFGSNDGLYQICFTDFINEPNAEALSRALGVRDYTAAFDAAHALKGVSGNLGLSVYYKAICALTESLRSGNYGNISEEYADVEREFAALRLLASDDASAMVPESTTVSAAAPPAASPATAMTSRGDTGSRSRGRGRGRGRDRDRSKNKSKSTDVQEAKTRAGRKQEALPGKKSQSRAFIIAMATALLVILILLFLLFYGLVTDYRNSIRTESASHLSEINYQLCRSVETNIDNDWRLAHTIAAFLAETDGYFDDVDALRLLSFVGATWDVSDLSLYTEDGSNICIDGDAEAKDIALERVVQSIRDGEYLTVSDSNITYTVPLQTSLTLNGSPVVALSTVMDMSSFLDNMEFSSFGGKAYMYLTDKNGKVFSRLTSSQARPVFNVMSAFTGDFGDAVTGVPVPAEMLLSAPTITVLTNGDNYIVTAPVDVHNDNFRLIYIVPISAVNATADVFTDSVIFASLIVLVIFAACAVAVVYLFYSMKKKQFDTELLSREHLFDLLVHNTRTAFGLFRLGDTSPSYISDNCGQILSTDTPVLVRRDGVFAMRDRDGGTPDTLRELNFSLTKWTGKGVFRSGFIKNNITVPPTYLEVQLFPTDSSVEEFVCIVQDVTQLQEREDTIRTALRMSEHGSEAKTRFLSNMSHDIRTPMNAIINMTGFAADELDSPERLREYLKSIRESSEHLLMLINDILEMSRIESGRTEIALAPFNLCAELNSVVDIVSPLCSERKQTFNIDINIGDTEEVSGDRIKLSRVLMNLLSNAVKFTPEGGEITFTADELPSMRDEYAYVRFIVRDNGIGIPEDFISHVFEPFSRADENRIGEIQGTGLGLSICHSYVTAMGGQISCESREGVGSTFTVSIYFKRSEASLRECDMPHTDTSLLPLSFRGKRCIVCDDNVTNLRIAHTVLEKLGFAVDDEKDGKGTIERFNASAAGYYDVIYMDIQMPGMDGYAATRAIRASSHPDARSIAVIAMTANVFMEDVERAHIAGMDGHIGKPVNTAVIAAETDRVLGLKSKGE